MQERASSNSAAPKNTEAELTLQDDDEDIYDWQAAETIIFIGLIFFLIGRYFKNIVKISCHRISNVMAVLLLFID